MKHALLSVCLLCFLTASCRRPKPAPLVRNWQAVKIHNANFEQMARDQQNCIDTMGSHTSPAGNDSLYGTRNIDSLRGALSSSLQSYRNDQLEITKHFQYDFRPDSVVLIRTIDLTDSARWYFEEPDILVLDERKLKGYGEVTRLQVLDLSDTLLRVRNAGSSNANTITSTFRPAK